METKKIMTLQPYFWCTPWGTSRTIFCVVFMTLTLSVDVWDGGFVPCLTADLKQNWPSKILSICFYYSSPKRVWLGSIHIYRLQCCKSFFKIPWWKKCQDFLLLHHFFQFWTKLPVLSYILKHVCCTKKFKLYVFGWRLVKIKFNFFLAI